jgi:hypothetical protein
VEYFGFHNWVILIDSRPYATQGIAVVTKICPPSKRVKMWPSDVAVVIGRRKTHGEMGATFNLMCRFFNELDRTATLKRIPVSIVGVGARPRAV